jgi:hypothetical protein
LTSRGASGTRVLLLVNRSLSVGGRSLILILILDNGVARDYGDLTGRLKRRGP